jgi:hypothetical protein
LSVQQLQQQQQQQSAQQSQFIDKQIDSNGRLFVKYWLLTAPNLSIKTNGETWGVSFDTIDYYIKSAVGMPLVMYQHPLGYLDHPEYYEQENYAVGRITDVVPLQTAASSAINRKTYAGIVEILNPELKEIILNDETKIPPFVSPAILPAYSEPIHNNNNNNNVYSNWKFAHLAIVGNPAFGTEARALKKCSGDALTCSAKLKTASSTKNKLTIKQLVELVFSSLNQKTASSNQNNELSTNISNDTSSNDQQPQSKVITTTDNTAVQQQSQSQQTTKQPDQLGDIINSIRERQRIDEEAKAQSQQKQQAQGPEQPPPVKSDQQQQQQTPELDYKTEYLKLKDREADLQKQIAVMQDEFKQQNIGVADMRKEVEAMRLESNRNKLRILIPRELFIKDDNTIDEKAYNKEIDMRIKQGYPNEVLSDDVLIEIYASKLQTLDNQRAKAQQQAPMMKTASSYHKDIGGFNVPVLQSEQQQIGTTESKSNHNNNNNRIATKEEIEELKRIYGVADYMLP